MRDIKELAEIAIEQLGDEIENRSAFEDGFIVGALTMKAEIDRLRAEIKRLKQN